MLSEGDIERIWFGCGNFGGIGSSPRLLSAGDSEQQALRLLNHSRRVGLRRFDTANSYGGGASEIVLGKWLHDQGSSFVQDSQLATKVGNPHGCPPGDTPLSKTQIVWHLDQSLRRLGVERIDLYYVHEFDRVTPLEETLEAMSAAADAGKIDRFGISNASLSDVQEVRSLASDTLASRFEYVENEFNLFTTADSRALIPYCVKHGLRYTAFSPLAGGLLTGKYRLGEAPPPNSRLAHASDMYKAHLNARSFASIEKLRQSAEERQQTISEAALHFVLDTPGIDGLIIAPRTIEQFESQGFAR